MYDVIIAGCGPAGLTAAIYACRSGLKTLLLERAFAGGDVYKRQNVNLFLGVNVLTDRKYGC